MILDRRLLVGVALLADPVVHRRVLPLALARNPAMQDGVADQGPPPGLKLAESPEERVDPARIERIKQIVAPVVAQANLDKGFEQSRPAVITNIDRIRTVPYVLAALLATLIVLSVVHVTLTTRRARRLDLAVLSALGATRGFQRGARQWQATSFTLVPVLLGVPFGVVLGRLVFITYADDMGAIDAPAVPLPLTLLAAVAVVALANLVALAPTRTRRDESAAQLLQTR